MKRKMERISVLLLAIIILAVTVETAETGWPTNAGPVELVIGLSKEKDSYIKLKDLVASYDGAITENISTKKEAVAIVAKIPFDSIVAFAKKAKATGAEYIEPNFRVQLESFPNDPYWTEQWGPQKIEVDWAWNKTFGDSSVLVAIIDSGIYYPHQDLFDNYAPLGYDWVNDDSDPLDDYGHGTKVAGIIGAVTNNGIGITGLAQVKLMAEKMFNDRGEGTVAGVANGIYHATDQGAKIISMSLSTPYNGSLLYDAVEYAYNSDVLLVASAGNYANETKRYPAAYEEVIAVTATDGSDQLASFSSFGDWVELAAPGVYIFSAAIPDESLTPPYNYYRYGSGTSYSCPHVSGLAALIWSKFPNASRDWVRTWLQNTTDDLGEVGFDEYYGWGRINARKAISPAVYTLTTETTTGGTTDPIPGTHVYPEGQNVPVQAIPDIGYGLDHWELNGTDVGSDNPYTILMDNNYTLKATFRQINHTLIIESTAGGTTNPTPGNYTFPDRWEIQVTAIPSTNYTLDYWELDSISIGSANPLILTIEANYTLKAVFRLTITDIAVTELTLSKTIIGQNYSTNIETEIANQGDYPETFNVTCYVNTTVIGIQTITNLLEGTTRTLSFVWNSTGWIKGNYTIWIYAEPLPNETNLENNAFIDGWVIVTIPGDVDRDFDVDIFDIVLIVGTYDSYEGEPRYVANHDIDGNGLIDIYDVVITANNYGEKYP